jgi:urocanate hydratase
MAVYSNEIVARPALRKAQRRLERVLTIRPGHGRDPPADAGYETADRVARERGVHVPHAKT